MREGRNDIRKAARKALLDEVDIDVTWAAIEALSAKSRTGKRAFEWETLGNGLYRISVSREVGDALQSRMTPGETISDVIIRVASVQ